MRGYLMLYLFPLLLILGGAIFGWLARWYRYGGRCRPGGLSEGVPNVDVERETVALDGSEPVMNTGRRRAAVSDRAKSALGSLTAGYERGRDDGMPRDGSVLATVGAAAGGAVASVGSAASAATETAKSVVEPLTDGTAREDAGNALRKVGDSVSGTVSGAADATKASLASARDGYAEGTAPGETSARPGDGSLAAKVGALAGGAVAATKGAAATVSEGTKSAIASVTGKGADGGRDARTDPPGTYTPTGTAGFGRASGADGASDSDRSTFSSLKQGYAEGTAPGDASDAPGDGSVTAKIGALAGGAIAATKGAAATVSEGTKSAIASVTGKGADGTDTSTGANDASGSDGSTLASLKEGYADGAAPGDAPDAPGDGSITAKIGALAGGAAAAVSGAVSAAAEKLPGATIGQEDGHVPGEGDADDADMAPEVDIPAEFSEEEREAQRLIEREEGVTRPATLLDAPRADRTPDNLKRIRGIGPKIEGALNDEGVYYFDQIAGFGASEIAWADRTLAVKGRVVRDRWVPQAQGLAALGPDDDAVDTLPMRSRFAALSDAADDGADGDGGGDVPNPAMTAPLSEAEREAQRIIEADEAVEKPASTLDAPREGRAPDDLQRISGIGPKIETTLNGEGIYYYDQIAGFGGRDLAWADRTLGFRGRVVRDRWIPQARALAMEAGSEVTSPPPAPAERTPFVGDATASPGAPKNTPLSEAEREALRLVEQEGGFAATAENRPESLMRDGPVAGKPDDLRRIKGIGEKLEGVLNGLGVYYFRQIAGFTARDIAWIDSKLKFKGRIIRDRWVPQAAVLASEHEG